MSTIRVIASTGIQVDGMNQIQTGDIELSYEDEGDGQPVVFVHGSISDSRNWNQHRGMITAQFRMIALTQRYFGLSPWSDDGRNFSIQTHADDLAGFSGALAAGSCSTYRFSPWEKVSADIKMNVLPLPSDFSCSISKHGNFRFGSKAAVETSLWRVCFTPISGRSPTKQ